MFENMLPCSRTTTATRHNILMLAAWLTSLLSDDNERRRHAAAEMNPNRSAIWAYVHNMWTERRNSRQQETNYDDGGVAFSYFCIRSSAECT